MEFKVQTEEIELPSKGLLYPKESPLASGKIEMKYMTAKEEDIITNTNYIKKGIAIDKLMQALIVSPIDYNELLIGDKNAIMVASRILGYGPNYSFEYDGETHEINLSQIDSKPLDPELYSEQALNIKENKNEFNFTLPSSGHLVTFKFLTHRDEKAIDRELEGLKKINKDASPDISTRLKYLITSVNGDRETKTIREFVDKYLLARDAKALRAYIKKIQPDIDLTFFPDGNGERVNIPIRTSFFWPDDESSE